jgi:transcriptional regulator with XRE-family HTH domain
MPYVPTIRARRLAHELRRLREERKITMEHLAEKIGWEQSKISRVENARSRTTGGDVMELCSVYGIEGEQLDELVRLARESRIRGWWHPYQDVLKEGFSDFLSFEAAATTCRGFEVSVVPGLFQTAEYARALFRSSTGLTDEQIDRSVRVRLARQERLTNGENPLDVWQILDESALRRLVGDPGMMKVQFQHLLELGQLSNVSLQVLPFAAGVHAAIDGPFVLLGFESYPDIWYLENLRGGIFLEEPDQTRDGSIVFDHLRSAALNTSSSAAMISEAIDQLSAGH